jgi:mannose-6-phosphate isomerase-like protein (cupin superfamily)
MRAPRSFLLLMLCCLACDNESEPVARGGTERLARQSDSVPTPDRPARSDAGGIELYPSSRLAAIADELAKGATTGRTVGAHETFHYVEARRTTSGAPEVHHRWVDVTLVQAGRATLLSGGDVQGGRDQSDGEYRGGTILGGTTHAIAAGDLFVVPAGVPHQFVLARGDSVRYLTIKVLQTGQ